MLKKLTLFLSFLVVILTLCVGPMAESSLAIDNMETSEKQIELEKEEEELFTSKIHFELIDSEFLYHVELFPDHQLGDYIVYLSKETRPPRV